ncbi:MAG: single-stranded DNA-binding protein [Methylococcales bacterium]
MIQASIYGRIGTDPKPGMTKTGKSMCFSSVAVDVGKEPGETMWISVLTFGKNSDSLQRHQKGDMLAIMGKLTRGKYTASDGTERESWTLLADSLHSCRTVRPGGGRRSNNRSEQSDDYSGFDDEIPFD